MTPPPCDALRPAFAGERIVGFGYDRHVLEQARLERADAFVAATAGDNRNIVAALAARRRFRVPIVVARIYDPDRAEIYRAQGIRTVSPVRWSAGTIRDILLHPAIETETEFGNGEVAQIRVQVPPAPRGPHGPGRHHPRRHRRRRHRARGPRRSCRRWASRFERDDVARFVVAREAYGRFESFLGMRG